MTSTGHRVLVVGTGLIGTSIGLALTRAGAVVGLRDALPAHLSLAESMGAGSANQPGPFDACFVCVPPAQTPQVVTALLGSDPYLRVSDTASVKSQVELEVESMAGPAATRFLGGHPVAGREHSGPAAARPDLFAGRPWVLTERSGAQPGLGELFADLVAACGAHPVRMPAERHDELLAVSSHLPQLLASALAEQAARAGELAGPGLTDMTRIADSDPELWGEIAAANRDPLAAALRRICGRLSDVASALETGAGREAVLELIAAGRAGRRRLPGKHGGDQQRYATVAVVVPDAPGELARLLADVAAAQVNVEDVRVDHAPGGPVGIVALAVEPRSAARLRASLTSCGWAADA